VPLRQYKSIKFSSEREALVLQAIQLVANYKAQGYSLTLRQLYYQFVARNWFPMSWADPVTGSTNTERSYKKLGDVLTDARMAGRLDWDAIEDRTREVEGNPHWESPAAIIDTCVRQYKIDKWEGQDYRVEVWVEKDALEGVVSKAARANDVQYFSCRGYASVTSIWNAGQRLKKYAQGGQEPVILHLGDHDPSGIDMSRDIEDRVAMFMDGRGNDLTFKRIALNMAQVRQHNPPPNPAKVTDSRFKTYQQTYGQDCWELDALDPAIIDALINQEILKYRDDAKYQAALQKEQDHRDELVEIADDLRAKHTT
jgi:hypothetical protein